MEKFLLFLPYIIMFSSIILFFLFAGILIIFLMALSLISIPVSMGMMVGLLSNVASDLNPVSIFFAGICCGAVGIMIAIIIRLIFPKALNLFLKIFDWYRLYEL